MAGGLGLSGYVGFGRESSGGVAVAPTHFIEALSEGLSGEYDRYEIFNIAGRLAEPDDAAGVLRVAGGLVVPWNNIVGGHLLKNCIGSASVSTTGVGGGLWRHSFKSPIASQWDDRFALVPYTYEVHRDVGSAQQYSGCNINQLELSIAPNQPLQLSADIMAVSVTNKASVTASYNASNVALGFEGSSISIAGAAALHVEQFNFTYNNQLEGVPTLAARNTITKIKRSGFPMTTFQLTVGFEDIDDLNRYLNQTELAIKLAMQSGPTSSFGLIIDLPRCVYTAFPTGVGGRGRQTVQIDGKCRYQQSSQTAFQIDVITTVGSY